MINGAAADLTLNEKPICTGQKSKASDLLAHRKPGFKFPTIESPRPSVALNN